METKLIKLDYELILIIIKFLTNKDIYQLKLTCKRMNNIINNMSLYDKSSRIIVGKIKKYINIYSKKERICKLLQYYIYLPHKQLGINVYYLDVCNRHNIYKKFYLKIRYIDNNNIVNIKVISNDTKILGNLSFSPEMIDYKFMCQYLLDMIEKYDPKLCSVKIKRIKND